MTFAIAFALYMLAMIAVGLLAARRGIDTDEDYYLGGRKLGPWLASFSASASAESGWVTLGLVGWAFTSGMSAYWILPGCLLGFAVNWFVLAKPMHDRARELGAVTVPDLLSLHFRERLPLLRLLSVGVILVAMWLYVAAQFAAAGKAFGAAFENVDYVAGVFIGGAIVLVYTVLGGFRASCWTDVVQATVMALVLGVFPLWLIGQVGGWEALQGALSTVDADVRASLVDTGRAVLEANPNGGNPGLEAVRAAESGGLLLLTPERTGIAFVGFLLGSGALGINLGFVGQPHIHVRFLAMANPRDRWIAGTVSILWGAVIFWGAVTIGLVCRAMVHGGAEWADPLAAELATGASGAGEAGLVVAANALLPGIVGGLALAAVFSAICSTADSQLVVAASAAASDVYGRLVKREGRGHMLVNRLTVLLLGIGAMLIVMDEDMQVFSLVLDYGWAILGAAFGPQVMLAMLWRRASYAGTLAGMATGFAAAIWFKQHPLVIGETSFYNLTVAFVAALVVNVVVSLVTPGRSSSGEQAAAPPA